MPGTGAGRSGRLWQHVVVTASVGLRSERGPILMALMLSTGLVAIDSTVIATAVPSIVRNLGGFAEFPWLFSIYLLAQAVTVPVYGKLADLFGRKPLILFGIGSFLLGSILCGFAWNMSALIAFRVVQGIGAGAVQPISMTIVGDLYSLQERAKVQGYLASVWGAAAVIGPSMGGLFSEYVSWRWIFFINIPLCLLAAAMITRNFSEQVERTHPKIDYRGAVLLTSGCTLLILGVLEGGQAWDWISAPGIGVIVAGLVLIAGFVRTEQRVASPILPLWVFSRRLLITSSLVSAVLGALTLGLTSYIPTYLQNVLGLGPVIAGLTLATLSIGWPLASSQAGKIYLRIGFRGCALIGASIGLVGAGLLLLLGEHSHIAEVAGICLILGAALGLVASPSLVAAQSSVEWRERGVVTGNNMFCRSLGSALGVAVFGAIANAALGSDASAQVHPRGLLTQATQHVFLAVAVLAVGLFLAVSTMPGRSSDASE